MTVVIRPFRYSDLDALIKLAEVSFADDLEARGLPRDKIAQEARFMARWRMIPFRLFSALARYQWAIFVAEREGVIVGCASYLGSGRDRINLANLMVHPDYRRRGIGQALLEKRLEILTQKGCELVTTTIVADNLPSLNNVAKQGFELFSRYSLWESPLPLKWGEDVQPASVVSRPAQAADIASFKALETTVFSTIWLQTRGSTSAAYFPSAISRLNNWFVKTNAWTRLFASDGAVIGFLTARASVRQTKGSVARPIVAPENYHLLPTMLAEAGDWLARMGKDSLQMTLSDDPSPERERLIQQMTAAGWTQKQAYVQMVKWLSNKNAPPDIQEKAAALLGKE
jgi:GNAT superfamily N-acetyltransferase